MLPSAVNEMAVFISSKIESICNEVLQLSWHPSHFLLAVATHNLNESGEVAVLSFSVCAFPSLDTNSFREK